MLGSCYQTSLGIIPFFANNNATLYFLLFNNDGSCYHYTGGIYLQYSAIYIATVYLF